MITFIYLPSDILIDCEKLDPRPGNEWWLYGRYGLLTPSFIRNDEFLLFVHCDPAVPRKCRYDKYVWSREKCPGVAEWYRVKVGGNSTGHGRCHNHSKNHSKMAYQFTGEYDKAGMVRIGFSENGDRRLVAQFSIARYLSSLFFSGKDQSFSSRITPINIAISCPHCYKTGPKIDCACQDMRSKLKLLWFISRDQLPRDLRFTLYYRILSTIGKISRSHWT